MSCDAVALSAFLWLASAGPAAAPAEPTAALAPRWVASEPLYIEIVRNAEDLKKRAEAIRAAGGTGPLPGPFETDIGALSALDMKGHEDLKARGVDGDLKCILRGISQDLPVKLKDIEAAKDAKARDFALREMVYLLRDNIEVITTPPKTTSTQAPPI